MYNGNQSQLSLFQASTGITFPFLQMAVNGTLYGAFRDEMMLIDQTGTQRLIVDVRSDPNWRTKITAEVDRLLSVPVGRLLDSDLTIPSIRVGDTTQQTVRIVNEGRFGLTLSGASTDVDGIQIDLGQSSLAPGDTASVTITYMPALEGSFNGTLTIETPGAISENVTLPIQAEALPLLKPRLGALPGSLSLGDLEIDRPRTHSVAFTNEGNADLVLTLNEASSGVLATGSVIIPAGETGSFTFRLDLDMEGTFDAQLVIDTNDPDTPSVEVPISAVGIIIPADPLADFDGSGLSDFSDFLYFAGVFGTSDPTGDINKNGTVDFNDFLVFAGSFGKRL